MRKNPFSYDAIRDVYDKENRKGNINLSMLPADYCDIIQNIQDKRRELFRLKRISIKKMDTHTKATHLSQLSRIKKEISHLYEIKENRLEELLRNIEKQLNNNSFRYEITRDERYYEKTGKESFHTKGEYLKSMIMSKLLCIDLTSAFKVKTSDRHYIMSCIKSLLVAEKNFFIIRTDIQNFFESIPHNLVLNQLQDNPLISGKTIGCIRSVLVQYDKIKSGGANGIGIPRGIAISSYLSEIIMRDFDMNIQKMPNVLFYARYVDDIFILLSNINPRESLDDFFSSISTDISKKGLKLHPAASTKSVFINYNPNIASSQSIEYLGYKIQFCQKNITFHLSDKRYKRIRQRIDNAFNHFEFIYKSNPRKARIDLIDSLNMLSGNTSLHKSKNGVRTGLYFSNDLLSDKNKQLSLIQDYYINVKVNNLVLDEKSFGTIELKDAYLNRLKKKLLLINFPERWKERKMYSFSIKRLKELSTILGE
ncbi:MAG: RNA-directed DNA polymerase [Bacteroides sp.]|nr:RNA-directed DNA polymerase [Bacteroides sp.]